MKTSKRQTTQYNKFTRCLSRIRELYSQARAFKMTSSEITKAYIERIQPEMKGLNQYYIGVLAGYKDCLYDALWQEMEFCYLVEGVLYTTARDTNKPRWDTLADYNMKGKLCAHFWKNTDKQYTEFTPA